MFKCQVLNRQSKPGEKLHKVVVETRNKTYRHWDEEAEENWESFGVETVREVDACEDGVRLWESLNADERSEFVRGLA